ncbi:MAG: porin [Planctomycetales bacterium]|nr:porin [Planctomycetales bacterium]
MKITKWALSAAIAATCIGASAFAEGPVQNISPEPSYFAQQPAPVVSGAVARQQNAAVIPAACACGDSPVSNCDSAIGNIACDSNGCDGAGCDGAGGADGEPWTLFQCPVAGFTVGGWTNMGYHTANNAGTGILGNGAPANFNNYADHVQLQQQWLFAEKVADGSDGLGFGGRVDYLYGTDGPDTQAFGIPNNHWDNSFDNAPGGAYGHAIPQLYAEAAYGKLSVKAGHFFTIIGNEVVAATGNFFYSRQFTFYNAEPFTHTGALSTYNLDDDTTTWAGYVMGWDSGFEDNGDAYISGFSRKLSDKANLIYTNALGRFNDKLMVNGNHVAERGQIHSMIFSYAVTDKLNYINQNDYLYTQDAAGTSVRNTFGSVHYLLYNVNDRVALGSRSEWFNFSSGIQNIRNSDILNQTLGVNYRHNANLVFRPEVRWVWDKDTVGVNENGKSSQAFFGTDMVMTF